MALRAAAAGLTARVYPDLVVQGEIESVQYQQLIPMPLNELQKAQKRVKAQSAGASLPGCRP